MDPKEIYDALIGSLGTYQGGVFGPSFYDQWKSANAGLDKLGTLGLNEQESAPWKSMLNAQKRGAGFGAATSVLNGAINIGTNAADLLHLQDTNWFDNNVDQIRSIGRGPINSVEDIVSMQNRINGIDTDISVDDIRGKSKMERFGSIGTSALSGASAGMTAFGPIGAAIGGAAGAAIGIGADLIAQQNARDLKREKDINAQLATLDSNRNMQAGIEGFTNYQFRNGIGSRKAQGGPIKTQTLQEFAQKVLKRRTDSSSRPSGIVRTHRNGGVVIRFKD